MLNDARFLKGLEFTGFVLLNWVELPQINCLQIYKLDLIEFNARDLRWILNWLIIIKLISKRRFQLVYLIINKLKKLGKRLTTPPSKMNIERIASILRKISTEKGAITRVLSQVRYLITFDGVLWLKPKRFNWFRHANKRRVSFSLQRGGYEKILLSLRSKARGRLRSVLHCNFHQ